MPEGTSQIKNHELERERKQTFGLGLLKGLGVTFKHLFKRNTVIQYPDEKQDLPARTRGVIALKEENCTVCMLCGRECPDWCIYIDSHKETLPPKREGGRPRKRNVLDRFAIDYALCMYCGICVEVCPYDALFWSREFEYAEYDIRELTHEKERLSDWMATVLPPPELEEGAEIPGMPALASAPTVEATGARPPTATSSAVETRPAQAEVAPKAGTAAPTDARPTESLPSDEQKAETSTVPAAEPAEMAPETLERGEPGAEDSTATGKPAAAADSASPARSSEEASPSGPPLPAVDSTPSARSSETSSQASSPPAEARSDAGPSSSAATTDTASAPSDTKVEPVEDPQAVYERVLAEQTEKGSSAQVAEARAKVARVKAERGVRAQPQPAPVAEVVPSAPTKGHPTEPEPAGAPEASEIAPDPGPVAPEGSTETEQASASETETASAPESAPAPAASGSGEDPEAVYERVLQEERDKGSSDAVAVARAKAARMRSQKGTSGPGGSG